MGQNASAQPPQPIDAFAKIHRLDGHEDPALGGQLKHRPPSTKARTTSLR